MKKYDNFVNTFNELKESSRDMAYHDKIYRMGIIAQFNFSFELGWKALKEVLAMHGVQGGATGSPREIIKLAFSVGFMKDEEIWLDMLQRRNKAVHVYDEEAAEELIDIIYSEYIPALERFSETLAEKIASAK